MEAIFKNKVVLVTGGLGSIGSVIVERLLAYGPRQVRILDNRETELFYARKKYETYENVRLLYGDVREKERLLTAMHEVDIVFHAAALKHVLLCEYDPLEAVKTNVLGTQNVIDAAIQNKVGKVIFISTDKAVNPTNVMGTTKLLAERLISSMYYNKGRRSNTEFGAVRFGNVLYSNGSVVELWERQLEEGKNITVTDPEMTRFFMTIPQSVDLIFEACCLAGHSEVFIFKMPSVRIKDLAAAFLELKGLPPDKIEVIGRKKGEKLHEELFIQDEQEYLLENDRLFVRLALFEDKERQDHFLSKGFKPCTAKSFSSANHSILLPTRQIKELLKKSL